MEPRNQFTKGEVVTFKDELCDENKIIASLIQEHFAHRLGDVILDVGAGIGDIAFEAFASKRVYLLDLLNFGDWPTRPNHTRKVGDFFKINPSSFPEVIDSIFISHTIQCLDDHPPLLHEKVAELEPDSILLIMNENDGHMSSILMELWRLGIPINPELSVPAFPSGYEVRQVIPFVATIKCMDHEQLFEQITYLMLIPQQAAEQHQQAMVSFLKRLLPEPILKVRQNIKFYQK